MFFFHLVVNVERDRDSWKWNYYRTNKTYAIFPGIFESDENDDSVNLQFVNELSEKMLIMSGYVILYQ